MQRGWRPLVFLALLPAVLLAAWLYEPYVDSGPTLCLWRRAFDIECLSCGLTRALCSLAHGRIAEAIAIHPLIMLIVPAACLICARGWSLTHTSPQRFRKNHSTPKRPTNSRKNGQVSQ